VCWNIYMGNVQNIQLSHPGEKSGEFMMKV
jgi:hypothetical protein